MSLIVMWAEAESILMHDLQHTFQIGHENDKCALLGVEGAQGAVHTVMNKTNSLH